MNKLMANAVAAALTAASLLVPVAVQAQSSGAAGTAAGSGAATTTGAARAGDAKAGDARGARLAAGDRRFINEAAQSDMAELTTSKMAQQKGQSDAVKQFAQMMITDHTATSEKLASLAQAKGVTLPTDVDRKHKRMASRLEKADGADFDREYMQGQVSAHRDAVRLFERQAKNGRDEDLKQFASSTLPRLREHLAMAEKGADGMKGGRAGHDMGKSGRAAAGGGAGGAAGAGAAAGASGGTTGGAAGGTTTGGAAGGTTK